MKYRVGKWFPVESMSFPRCGHKLTTDLLQTYFGPEFIYAGRAVRNSDLLPGVHFTKFHDFDLDAEIRNDRAYIVQVRDPFDAIYSWHKMTVDLDGIPDDVPTLREIMKQKQDYWAGFVKKWVASEIPNRVVLRYEDILDNPEAALAKIIPLFGEVPNPVLVSKAVREVCVHIPPRKKFYL